MAIAKKGLRKITVDNQEYLFKIGKIKSKLEFRAQQGELHEDFVKAAAYFGLGAVADSTITIAVHSSEHIQSKLFVTIKTVLIDGFMGLEQLTQITPKQVASFIRLGLKDGWQPAEKGDCRLNFLEKHENAQPVLLQFPDSPMPDISTHPETYENVDKLVRVDFSS